MDSAVEAFFLEAGQGADGQRFCIFHPPVGHCHGAVLYVHPFGEEMNKSRRMVSLQARQLAQQGLGTMLLDLHGCGDSAGDLAEASWSGWVDDVVAAAHWLQARQPGCELWLWGLRTGALLASAALQRLQRPAHLLLWQPALAGKAVLQQFLRLRMAAGMADGGTKGVTEALRAELAAGRCVTVAGYVLPPAVAQGLEQAQLHPPAPEQQMLWLEVSPRVPAELSPASVQRLQAWSATGHVRSMAVIGPAFWQTTEIEDAPHLLAVTTSMMAEALAT